MSPLRAVLFDAGGTLFVEQRPRPRMYADVARRHGLACDEAAIGRAMAEVHAELPVRVGGSFRYTRPWFEHFIAEVFARAGAPALPPGIAPDLFDAFANAESFRVFEEVPPLLLKLRRAGLRLAVVSNWSPALDALLDGLGLAAHFDAVVSSGREEVEKPAPGIFTLALARLGVPAETARTWATTASRTSKGRGPPGCGPRCSTAAAATPRRGRPSPLWPAWSMGIRPGDRATGRRARARLRSCAVDGRSGTTTTQRASSQRSASANDCATKKVQGPDPHALTRLHFLSGACLRRLPLRT